jgi:hypothetical protein
MQGGLSTGSNNGGGNIDVNPFFVDADGSDSIIGTEDDNLRLQSVSPCIDAGDSNAVPADTVDLDDDLNTLETIPFDLAGRIRLVDNMAKPDTGLGGPPVVDMGAFEYQCEGNLDAVAGVNLADVALLADRWMDIDCGFCGGADFTGDNDVTVDDLLILTANWLCGAAP